MNTLVLTIEELHQTVKNTTKLEGKSFKNTKDLLVKLIKAIEETEEWQFVQYIQHNPSLFIIRRKEEVKSYKEDSMLRSVVNLNDYSDKVILNDYKVEKGTEIPTTKLPW